MSRGYNKLFECILDSTVWLQDDHVRLVWITLLAMKDKDGIVLASIPGLAQRARVPLDLCQAALAKLQEPDPFSRTKVKEGRRIEETDGGWFVINHQKYRDLFSAETKREADARRAREYRERQRAKRDASRIPSQESVTERDSVTKNRDTITSAGSGVGVGSDSPEQEPPDRLGPRAGEQPGGSVDQPAEPDVTGGDDQALTLQQRAEGYLRDPFGARMQMQPAETWPEVVTVLEAWAEAWGQEVELRGGLRDPRLSAILEAYAVGSTVRHVCEAVWGSAQDAFLGANPKFQTLATVLKNPETVDKYRSLLPNNPMKRKTGMAKRHAEALEGAEGERAQRLAREHQDPMHWYYAMEAQEDGDDGGREVAG